MPSHQIIEEHQIFRILLQSMSRPGTVHRLTEATESQPALSLLSCIIDNEVSVTAIGDEARELVTQLCRQQGSRPTDVSNADVIIISGGSSGTHLETVRLGDLEYPDTGATVLYLVDFLEEGAGECSLTGPGINGTASLRINGLDRNELQLLRNINSAFPLGIDAIFVDRQGQCVCIPRSTVIKVY